MFDLQQHQHASALTHTHTYHAQRAQLNMVALHNSKG